MTCQFNYLHTALHGHSLRVGLLLNRGNYEVDQQDSCGTTPLMDAVKGGHRLCADQLYNNKRCRVTCVTIVKIIHYAAILYILNLNFRAIR